MKKIWILFVVLSFAFIVIINTIFLGINSSNINSNSQGGIIREIISEGKTNSQDGILKENLNQESGNISSSEISLIDLKKHNTKSDCWVIYKNRIYDLSSWLPIHSGGAKVILPYCGTQEFEQAFIKQHGNSQASRFMRVAVYMGDFKEIK